MSIYALMINSYKKRISDQDKAQKSSTVSIILSAQNDVVPAYLHPQRVKALAPKRISSEIIVIHYNQADGRDSDIELDAGPEFNRHKKNDITQISCEKDDEPVHVIVKGKFMHAIMKGVELSTGQFILIFDTDFPYPEELVPKLISELVNSPNSIIIAPKYAKKASVQTLPFMRTMISKGARIIARHGLKVQDV